MAPRNPFDVGMAMIGTPETDAAVKEYLANGGVNLDPATQAWCAAFVNSTLKQSGLPQSSANSALSFKSYGDPVITPRRGDIGVFARHEDPTHSNWEGHAGIYSGVSDPTGDPVILSGNANDRVLMHPIESGRLIGWRRPPGVQEPALPETLASAVSPDVNALVASTDRSRGLGSLNQRMEPPTPRSAVDTVGGVTTPSIAASIRRARLKQAAEDAAWSAGRTNEIGGIAGALQRLRGLGA
jgi:uncharacterized protein (TIGR02594 family)